MSTVVRPAISPYGHVAGLATWKVRVGVLAWACWHERDEDRSDGPLPSVAPHPPCLPTSQLALVSAAHPPMRQVVLAEKQQCPFTNQPLQFEQVKLLTLSNIHLWRDKIVNGSAQSTQPHAA